MNRREKKKLRKKYLDKVLNATILAKNQLVIDEEHIELLYELRLYVECSDFRTFYEIYKEYLWPSYFDKDRLMDRHYKSYNGDIIIKAGPLENLRSGKISLTREVTLKKLGI